MAAVALLLLVAARGVPALDLHVETGARSHALLRMGFATIELVFDSGQACSESNGCGGVLK